MNDELEICSRVVDIPIPLLRAKQGICDECHSAIWVEANSRAKQFLCIHCAIRKIVAPPEPFSIDVPNEAQMQDLERKLEYLLHEKELEN